MQRLLARFTEGPPEAHDRVRCDPGHVGVKVIANVVKLMEHRIGLLVQPDGEVAYIRSVHTRHDLVPRVIVQLQVLREELGLGLDHARAVPGRAMPGPPLAFAQALYEECCSGAERKADGLVGHGHGDAKQQDVAPRAPPRESRDE